MRNKVAGIAPFHSSHYHVVDATGFCAARQTAEGMAALHALPLKSLP
jgi:hypothetical protein